VGQHRFLSPSWVEMAREQIAGALADQDLAGIDFTLCEELTDPPDDLRREGEATIGFFVRVRGRRVERRLQIVGHPSEAPAALAELDIHWLLASRTR